MTPSTAAWCAPRATRRANLHTGCSTTLTAGEGLGLLVDCPETWPGAGSRDRSRVDPLPACRNPVRDRASVALPLRRRPAVFNSSDAPCPRPRP